MSEQEIMNDHLATCSHVQPWGGWQPACDCGYEKSRRAAGVEREQVVVLTPERGACTEPPTANAARPTPGGAADWKGTAASRTPGPSIAAAHAAGVAEGLDRGGWQAEVTAEVARARAKFPMPNPMLAALVEEVGELAKALMGGRHHGKDGVRMEAIQVAAMAVRILEEGDPHYPESDRDAAAIRAEQEKA